MGIKIGISETLRLGNQSKDTEELCFGLCWPVRGNELGAQESAVGRTWWEWSHFTVLNACLFCF